MYVSVHHNITNPQEWAKTTRNIMAMTEQGRLPNGLKGLMYLPAVDGRRADCVWEANSVDALKNFLDRETGSAARNEYIQIKEADAFGLPGHEVLHKAA